MNRDTTTAPPVSLMGMWKFQRIFRADISSFLKGRIVVNVENSIPTPPSRPPQYTYYADVRIVLITGGERNIVRESAAGQKPFNRIEDPGPLNSYWKDNYPGGSGDVIFDFEHGNFIEVEARAMNAGIPSTEIFTSALVGPAKLNATVTLHGERIVLP